MKNYLTNRNDVFSLFDDAVENFFSPVFFAPTKGEMKTDISQTENAYNLAIDLPGFEKEEIELSLENGYLIVSAQKKEKSEENYVRRERSFSCKRSYYVGDNVTEEQIKAKYLNGTLNIEVPKVDKKQLPKKTINVD